MSLKEFEGYLPIDKTTLDDEIIQQPTLFWKVSQAYTAACSDRDSFKEQLARIDADLDGHVREQRRDEKTTETMIRNEVVLHPKHIKAFSRWLEAKTASDELEALKDAFQQRAYMLRDLVQLHSTNYYEDNAVKGTNKTDALVYRRQRARLAVARDMRNQE